MDRIDLAATAHPATVPAGVPLPDRIAMAVGLRLLVWAHERAAHRPTHEAEHARCAREGEALRLRDLLVPMR